MKTKNNNYGPAVWLFACILFHFFTTAGFAQTTTANLGISKPQAGQAQPSTTIATGFDSFDAAVAGRLSKSVAGSSNVTLTTTEARNAILEFTGILTGSINVIVPTLNRTYLVYNGTTGAFTLTVKTSGGTGIAVTQGNRVWLYCDATNVVETSVSGSGANNTLSNLSTTSINTALIPQTGIDLGSVAAPFKDLHLYGGGTFASHSWRFTGTPTGNRVVTIPDRTATMATTTGTLTNGRCVEFDASGNLVDAASASPCGAGSFSLVDWKDSVRVATTAAGTLATSFENGDTVDGVVLATGNRILIKDQAAGADNGIYVVAVSGAPARATDADTSAEVTAGMAVTVTEGTANADKIFTLTTNDPITLGSTSIAFAAVGSGGAPSWSSITAPSTDLSLAMAANLTTLTYAGNFSTSSAFKLVGNNTSATGPLLHLTTNSSNLIPPLLVEVRGANARLKVGHLGDVLIGQAAIGSTDTDGFPYLPVVGSNAFPTSTPTGQTGMAPVAVLSNGINGEYDLLLYANSKWNSVGGARKRYDTVSGSGAQTLDFNSNVGTNVTREFTITGNATLTFSNPPPAGSLVTVTVIQSGAGSFTVTWPGTVKWTAATAPTLTTTSGKRDIFVFMWNGSSYYNVSQQLNQ